jgi:serine phosphatase RsbU (regulator of sigma subunit)
MLTAEVAVAKVAKYAVRESGDSVEVVERPRGGLSVVMADGQRSGSSAKAISNIAVGKAISLLGEGVRDGAAARAAHDYLLTQRNGQVSAELTILSIDLESRTLLVTRNSRCPVLVAGTGPDGSAAWRVLEAAAEPAGVQRLARPVIIQFPFGSGLTVVAFTDGIVHAGSRYGAPLDPVRVLDSLSPQSRESAQATADALLAAALAADEGRPRDDTTVVVLRVFERPVAEGPEVRRMSLTYPISSA